MGLQLQNVEVSVVVAAAVMVAAVLVCSGVVQEARAEEEVVVAGCEVPLVVFGASMVDVGENGVAQPLTAASEFVPYGVDYFGRPVARFSNGRVISDFISQGLGYGLLDPYLNSVDPHFKHGVNFASSGSTARNTSGLFPFSLDVQIKQFKLFKAKVMYVQSKHGGLQNILSAHGLANGIYIMMPAHNDYNNVLIGTNFDAPTLTSAVVEAIEHSLRELNKEGARTLVLMNVLPLGCAPAFLGYATSSTSLKLDNDSCVASYNSVVDLHNTKLKEMVYRLREELSWDGLVLFDLNAMYMDAIRHPSQYGITQPFTTCCGVGGGEYNSNLAIPCGSTGTLNGATVTAGRCDDPTQHISWDGLHPTESFAKHIAYAILKSKFVEPHLSMEDACKA